MTASLAALKCRWRAPRWPSASFRILLWRRRVAGPPLTRDMIGSSGFLGFQTGNAPPDETRRSLRGRHHVVQRTQGPLGLGGLLVIGKSMRDHDLAGAGNLDAFGGCLVSFHLGHGYSL